MFGESDGLPGLVLDRYGDVLVGQIATAGMEALQATVTEAVRESFSPAALTGRTIPGRGSSSSCPQVAAAAFGEVPRSHVDRIRPALHRAADARTEDRLVLRSDSQPGAPRSLSLAAGTGLDVCSYVGAWGITALQAGAAAASCIDSSETALDFARRNAQANGVALETIRADAFEAMKALHDRGERFDVVVLDPPAFIKRKKDIPQGQAAYRKLNQLALA